ncbi:MAG: asparagine synthase (glutamine-hydrolyzing) [Rhodospirillaceae bacterium]
MCGIAGFLDPNCTDDARLTRTVTAMADRLLHRGPDAGGVLVDARSGLAFGHRRLSIVDLSPAGAQPMNSADGRFVVCYNGELYNAPELALELDRAGVVRRGHSDTEILVEWCARRGVRALLEACEGMFAFALWDRSTRTLTLARDRLGIKPLYWLWRDGLLVFGSELKALTAHPGWRPEIDPAAVSSYLRFGYVPAPAGIYKGVHKLEPGGLLTLVPGGAPVLESWWRLRDVARAGQADLFPGSPAEATDELERLLRRAVRGEMMADVPLGCFLSGGIDSSTVAALMQAESPRPVRTFSIGFRASGYDEAADAAKVAAHLGTDHTEFHVDPADGLAVIPHLAEWYDEPFADSSQIPTYIVSRLARQHVTVALSGDGGDELFAGYTRYVWAERLWRRLGRLPLPLRRVTGAGLAALSGPIGAMLASGAAALLPAGIRPSHPADKLRKLAGILPAASDDALFRRLISLWPEPERLVPGVAEPHGALWDESLRSEFPDFTARMQMLDTVSYLPDDILTKVDRASMAVALEARVPLLNHKVVEFAWRLPLALKIREGQSKWLLRQVLYRHVPRALVDRPKQGFSIPLAGWLRGPLRDWAESLLTPAALSEDGLLDPVPIRRAVVEHMTGRRDHAHALWAVLMLQAWRARTRSGS